MSRRPTKARTRYWPQKLRSPLKRHGGKWYLARRIFQLAPARYDLFLDAYCGAGTMVLNAPAVARIGNDLDWQAFNVLKLLGDPAVFPMLLSKLLTLAYEEPTFLSARRRLAVVNGSRPATLAERSPRRRMPSYARE